MRFAVAIFLSAFLLFFIQPLIAKSILPWFGGGSAIWSTCMLFFQTLLLAGYGYAHWLAQRRGRTQALVHIVATALTLIWLPIGLSNALKPESADSPVLGILLVLMVAVGGPYFVLATNSPLIQHWFERDRPGASPYRLYALSNIGSLGALLLYPFVIEPLLKTSTQLAVFSAGYAVFIAIVAWLAFGARYNPPATQDTQDAPLPTNGQRIGWVILAACGSVLFLGATHNLTKNVAPVPFLWILPLVLYLLTFIIVFDKDKWYSRVVWGTLFLVAVFPAVSAVSIFGLSWGFPYKVVIYGAAVLVGCMLCHGELARSRPAPKYLTQFYLLMSAGGALGGLFVSLVAPVIFNRYWEFHLAMVGTFVLFLASMWRDPTSRLSGGKPVRSWVMLTLVFWFLVTPSGFLVLAFHGEDQLFDDRNFYGTLHVLEKDEHGHDVTALISGHISHGVQLRDPAFARHPTSYYHPNTGFGLAMQHHTSRPGPLDVGVIGLGAGVGAVYANTGDVMRYYEINPDVEYTAREFFSFLEDAQGEVSVTLGDARIVLERELEDSGSRQFDVLVVDAFTGDSIPVHLLTTEVAEIYFKHLKDDGVLAIHVTNGFLELTSVVQGLADALEKKTAYVVAKGEHGYQTEADWVLVTSNEAFLAQDVIANVMLPWPKGSKKVVWTDDYASLFAVMKY